MKLLLAVAFLVVAYASVSVAQEEYKCGRLHILL